MSQRAEGPLVLPLAGLVADASGLGVLRARRAGGRSLAVARAAASKKNKKKQYVTHNQQITQSFYP